MSLSKNETAPRRPPRVIMGVNSLGPTESTLAELQGQRDLTRWTSKTEEEYMTRVRDRATGAAKEIISKAMNDAVAIRENAMTEGFQAAAEEAQTQLDAAVQGHAQTLAQTMAAVEQGTAALWDEHRADISALVRLTVERILGVELNQRREEVLASILDQALEAVDSQRQLCVRVCPQDEDMVSDLMARAKDQHPSLDRWCVRADDKLGPGGMVLESTQGMVDNSMESRTKAVMEVLDQMDDAPPAAQEESSE